MANVTLAEAQERALRMTIRAACCDADAEALESRGMYQEAAACLKLAARYSVGPTADEYRQRARQLESMANCH